MFVSYAHADADRVKPLVAALRAQGLLVWFDEEAIEDFESITRAIRDGVARSKVLVAYYSTSYPQRRPCQWELTAAFLAAGRGDDPRQRVLVVNPEPSGAHIEPVELRDALYTTAPSLREAESFADLAGSIAAHLRRVEGVLGDIRQLTSPAWLPIGTRGVGSTRFVGRVPVLWQLHSALHAGDAGLITGAHAGDVAQVRGLGGIGKSLLAEEYALRFGSAYPGGIFWLDASGDDHAERERVVAEAEADRHRQLRVIASQLGVVVDGLTAPEVEGALARTLERAALPCLWIVDDLPFGLAADEVRRWFAPHPLAKTLFTTRSRDYGAVGTTVDLELLSEDEAYKLLTGRRAPVGHAEETAARALVEELGRHPLAVDVAGSALASLAGLESFAGYRVSLAHPSDDELELAADLAEALPNGHQRSIVTTIGRSIERLEDEGSDFLRLASALATAAVPARLVAAVFGVVDGLDSNTALRRAALALRQADRLSLAERDREREGACSVHALVSRTMRFTDACPERREALRAAAIQALVDELPVVEDARAHTELELCVAHARELARPASSLVETELLGWVGRYELVRGEFLLAESLHRRQVEARRQLLGDEHPETLSSMRDLGEALWEQRDLAATRAVQEEVLEVRSRVLGKTHPDTLAALDDLALTLAALGDLGAARTLAEEALAGRRRILGDDHLDTLTSMENLASILGRQGVLARARSLEERVLEGRRRLLGDDHQHTLTSMGSLAGLLSDLGCFEHARVLHEQELEGFRRVLGDEHPHTLLAKGNLAVALGKEGKHAQAEALHADVLEVRRRTLGDDHPDTLVAMSNLAWGLRDNGDLFRARALHWQVLTARRRQVGQEHPATLRSEEDLAWTVWEEGDHEQARALQEHVVDATRRLLGDENPETLSAKEALAYMLWNDDDLRRAQVLQEEALAARRRLLGDEHPDTLKSRACLARMSKEGGDFSRARELQEEVLDARRRLLGEEHPMTLSAMHDLCTTLRSLGDDSGAEALEEQVLQTRRRMLWAGDRDMLRMLDGVSVGLARELVDRGAYSRARALHTEMLEVRREVLGAEHPDTLTSMANLAFVRFVEGDLAAAQELDEQVLTGRRRALGEDHPETLAALDNLAMTLEKLGAAGAARALQDQALATRRRLLGAEHPAVVASARRLDELRAPESSHGQDS